MIHTKDVSIFYHVHIFRTMNFNKRNFIKLYLVTLCAHLDTAVLFTLSCSGQEGQLGLPLTMQFYIHKHLLPSFTLRNNTSQRWQLLFYPIQYTFKKGWNENVLHQRRCSLLYSWIIYNAVNITNVLLAYNFAI